MGCVYRSHKKSIVRIFYFFSICKSYMQMMIVGSLIFRHETLHYTKSSCWLKVKALLSKIDVSLSVSQSEQEAQAAETNFLLFLLLYLKGFTESQTDRLYNQFMEKRYHRTKTIFFIAVAVVAATSAAADILNPFFVFNCNTLDQIIIQPTGLCIKLFDFFCSRLLS